MAKKRCEVVVYTGIGGWFGLRVDDVNRQLREAADAEEVVVRIHSMGGDALAGVAINNILRSHKGKKIVCVDGLAASAASMIAVAGDEVVMAEGSMMMLHNPWSIAIGDAEEMRHEAEVLDAIGRSYVSGYQRKCGKSADQIRATMEKESWLTAEECVAMGLADRVGPPIEIQARAMDPTRLQALPAPVARFFVSEARSMSKKTEGGAGSAEEKTPAAEPPKGEPKGPSAELDAAQAKVTKLESRLAELEPLLAQVKDLTGKEKISEQQTELAQLAVKAERAATLQAQLGDERQQLLAKAKAKGIPPVAMKGWQHLSLDSLREVVAKTEGVKAEQPDSTKVRASEDRAEVTLTDNDKAEFRKCGITDEAKMLEIKKSMREGK